MEPRRSDRIKISKERDFGVLLGALIRELPDVFEAEVLTKLSVKDHLALAQVNKECKDVVYRLEPLQFIRSKCIDVRRAFPEVVSVDVILGRVLCAAAQTCRAGGVWNWRVGRYDVLKWLWEPSRRPVGNWVYVPVWVRGTPYDSPDMHSE